MYRKGNKPGNWSPCGHHYVVTVMYNEYASNFDYWGSYHDKQMFKEPEVYDMVQAIFSDAMMALCYGDATDIMEEFGYTPKEARKVFGGITHTFESLTGMGFTESQIEKLSTVADDAYEMRRNGVVIESEDRQSRTLKLLASDRFTRPYTIVYQGTSCAIAVQEAIDFEDTYCKVVLPGGEYSDDINFWSRPIQAIDTDNCVVAYKKSYGQMIEEVGGAVDAIGTQLVAKTSISDWNYFKENK